MWFIGEKFLWETVMSFKVMRCEAIVQQKHSPYLFTQFNVDSFYPNPLCNTLILARVLNALACALKESHHLPKYVIIILDKNLVHSAGVFDYGAENTFLQLITWLLKEFNLMINTRCEDLRSKKPGAIANFGEPKLVWIKMLNRPIITTMKGKEIFSLVRKFNHAMETAVADDRLSHIIKIMVPPNDTYFDQSGDLTAAGRIEFWKDLDEQMKTLDRN